MRHSESIVMQSPCRVAEAPLPGHREHLVLSTGTARTWERLGEETEGRECPRCPPSPQRSRGLSRIHLQLCSLSGKKKPCSLPGTRPRLPFLLCRRMAVAGLKEPACACRRGDEAMPHGHGLAAVPMPALMAEAMAARGTPGVPKHSRKGRSTRELPCAMAHWDRVLSTPCPQPCPSH